MQVADFISAAGCDPYAETEILLGARPGEVTALGEAFTSASAALHSSGGLSTIAGQLADASAIFDGAAPTDLMQEVTVVQQTLAASPEVLATIGGALCTLAGSIAIAQQQVTAALADLEEQAVPILVSYAQSADVIVVGAQAWWNQHINAGVALVQQTHAAVCAAVDAHDAKLAEMLLALQAVGYLMPPDVDAGISTPSGVGTEWISGAVPYYEGMSAQQTAQWWAALNPSQQAVLIQGFPKLLSLLHGLPAAVYHSVNIRLMEDDDADIDPPLAELAEIIWNADELTDEIKEIIGITGPQDVAAMSYDELDALYGWMVPASYGTLDKMKALRKQKDAIDALQESLTVGEDGKSRYLLEYDLDEFDGDGKAVLAIGEVETAQNVAVVVQGATHDLNSIDAQTADAEAVLTEMDAVSDDDNAVIVYEGYDNPSIPQAAFYEHAIDGGTYLADDLDGYAAAQQQATGGADVHTTVIAHSYGTTTTSFALRDGAADVVDDLVLYGSPGVGVPHVSGLGLDADHVYAGMNPNDILDQFDMTLPGVSMALLGPDPTKEGFGATALGTGGVYGHGDYFGYWYGEPTESLTNAAVIAAGQPEKVILEHPVPIKVPPQPDEAIIGAIGKVLPE